MLSGLTAELLNPSEILCTLLSARNARDHLIIQCTTVPCKNPLHHMKGMLCRHNKAALHGMVTMGESAREHCMLTSAPDCDSSSVTFHMPFQRCLFGADTQQAMSEAPQEANGWLAGTVLVSPALRPCYPPSINHETLHQHCRNRLTRPHNQRPFIKKNCKYQERTLLLPLAKPQAAS